MGLMNRDYERPEPPYRTIKSRSNARRCNPMQMRFASKMAECQIKLREFDAALKTLEKCVDTPRKIVLQARSMLKRWIAR